MWQCADRPVSVASPGAVRGAEWAPSRAVRVFSKKLFGCRGAYLGVVWGVTVVGVDARVRGYDGCCGGALFGVVWGESGHDEWIRAGPGVAGARHEAGGRWPVRRRYEAGVVRQAHHEREAAHHEREAAQWHERRQAWHERGQGRREWEKARGGRRRAQQDGEQAQQADGIRCRRRASSGSRNEAAGIYWAGWGTSGLLYTKGIRRAIGWQWMVASG